MSDINYIRVFIGGLTAGLIIIAGEYVLNGVVLGDDWMALRDAHLIADPVLAQYMIGALITLSYGLVMIWIYAAIAPRFGPGPMTAIIAGAVFWVIAYVLFLLSVWANGFVTGTIAITSIAWGLIEAPLAALAGAYLYGWETGAK